MTAPTRKVSIDLFQVVGTALAGATVQFTLTRAINLANSGGLVPASATRATTDDSGQAEADLVPNALGTYATQYAVEIFDAQGVKVFPERGAARMYLPDQDSLLHAILYSVPPLSQSDADEAVTESRNWATYIGGDVPSTPGARSSKSWAQDDLRGATYGGSARDWAIGAGLVDGVTYYSARTYALQTADDRTQTGLDRIATGQDRVQTDLDAAKTAADRIQTDQDVLAANAAAASAGGSMLTAVAQAALATTMALSASSVAQQDLGGATLAALHRGPNTPVATSLYETWKDSNPLWPAQVDASYLYEPLNGTWLYWPNGTANGFESELAARSANATLAAEFIAAADRQFTSDTGYWTKPGTVTIGGGVAQFTNASTTTGLQHAGACTVGMLYLVTYTISGMTPGSVFQIALGSGAGVLRRGNGTYTEPLLCAANGSISILAAVPNTNGAVSNISIRQITAFNTGSGSFYPNATDGKFYRLWKNLVVQSANLLGSGWKSVTGSTCAANGNGSFRVSDTGNALTQVWNGTTAAFIPGFPVTFTIEFERQAAGVFAFGASNSWCYVDHATLATTPVTAFNGTNPSATVTQVSGTRYRATYTVTLTTSVSGINVYPALTTPGVDVNAGTNPTATGYLDVWLTQAQYGSAFDSYEDKPTTDQGQTETFRGSKARFPRVAGLVLEAGRLVVYDLLEKGQPMWCSRPLMTGAGATGMFAIQGVVTVVGNANLCGLQQFDFAKDRIGYQANTQLKLYQGVTKTTNTNVAGFVAVTGTTGILPLVSAASSYNCVAACVMPGSPVDPVTGLQVPTWAVGHSGGAAIVQTDGSVLQGGDIMSVTGISINQYALVVDRASSAFYYALAPSKLANAFALTLINSGSAYPDFNRGPSVAGTSSKVAGRGTIGRLTSQQARVSWVRLNEMSMPSSPAWHATNDHSTGLLAGAVIRCLLSDVDAGAVSAANLYTGGDVAAAFTPMQNCTLATVGSEIELTATAAGVCYADISAGIAVTGKNTYLGAGNVRCGQYAGVSYVGFQNNSTYSVGTTSTSAVQQAVSFSTNGSAAPLKLRIRFDSTAIGQKAYFSLLVVSEGVAADRSSRNKPSVVYGTPTKTQVAAAAQLVFWGNWSAANYVQEPFSADYEVYAGGTFTLPAHMSMPAGTAPATGPAPGGVAAGSSSYLYLPLANFPASAVPLTMNTADWTKGTGWSASAGGTITCDGSQTGSSDCSWTSGANRTLTGNATVRRWTINVTAINGPLTIYPYSAGPFTVTAPGTYTGIGGNWSGGGSQLFRMGAGGTCSLTVTCDDLGTACLGDRSAAAGAYWRLGVNAVGYIVGEVSDAISAPRVVSSQVPYVGVPDLLPELSLSSSGTLTLRVDGAIVGQTTGAPLQPIARYNMLANTSAADTEDVRSWGSTSQMGTPTAADTVVGNATPAVFRFVNMFPTPSDSTVVGTQYEYSVEAKAGTYPVLQMYGNSAGIGLNSSVNFDLTNGTIYSANAGNLSGFTMTPLTGGWYRCRVLFTPTLAGSMPVLSMQDTANAVNAAGSSANGTMQLRKLMLNRASLAGIAYQRIGGDNAGCPVTTIGNRRTLDAPFPGGIALVRPSQTILSDDAAAFMFQEERAMFRDGAQVTLPDSSACVDLDYDPAEDKWKVVSAANESTFQGLVRTASAPVSAGSFLKVSHKGGFKLLARSTTNPGVDVTIPAQNLQEALFKRGEEAARLARLEEGYDWDGGFTATLQTNAGQLNTLFSVSPMPAAGVNYPVGATVIGAQLSAALLPAGTTLTGVASASQLSISAPNTGGGAGQAIAYLDFILPPGYEARKVFAGARGAANWKREGSTKDYIRLFDGFRERVRFITAPGSTADVHIDARRIAA